MAIKRKRSASELSSPTGSTTSSTCFPASSPIAFNPFSSSALMANASHLPSRTLKRVRGGRPSEDEVHQRTLGLLYSAQRHHPPPSSSDPGSPCPPATHPHGLQQDGVQRSLHSFWSIPSAPGPAASRPPSGADVPTGCGDCGVELPGFDADAMDVDMSGGGRHHACGPCRKPVCGHCSVTDVDGQRRCLLCAGRRVSLDGWTTAPWGCRV